MAPSPIPNGEGTPNLLVNNRDENSPHQWTVSNEKIRLKAPAAAATHLTRNEKHDGRSTSWGSEMELLI